MRAVDNKEAAIDSSSTADEHLAQPASLHPQLPSHPPRPTALPQPCPSPVRANQPIVCKSQRAAHEDGELASWCARAEAIPSDNDERQRPVTTLPDENQRSGPRLACLVCEVGESGLIVHPVPADVRVRLG